jgi:hypothetical protein
MSLLLLRRWHARRREETAGLPAPGPSPLAQPPRNAIVIVVVVVVMMAWLLARGYSAGTALEIIAGAGMLAAAIDARLADPQADR